jgi:hypothetical protein
MNDGAAFSIVMMAGVARCVFLRRPLVDGAEGPDLE